LVKLLTETETQKQYIRVKYFKHYNGTGTYYLETYSTKKNNDTWQIVTDIKETELETCNRFSLKHLIELAEAQTQTQELELAAR
jgi:IMP cyclohydrolase